MPANELLGGRANRNEDDQLAHAGRILLHLQAQLAELDHREQLVNQQLATLMDQQRASQRAQREADEHAAKLHLELDQRLAQVVEAEASLNDRALRLDRRDQELAARQEAIERHERAAHEQHEQLRRQLLEETEQQRRALADDRERVQTELDRRRAECEREIESQRSILAEERDALQQEHQQRLAVIAVEHEQQRLQLAARQEELRRLLEEQEQRSRQWTETREQERRRFVEELEAARRERLSALDLRERELERREVDLQKRFRLHEAHLERARSELICQRTQLEWERQRQRCWMEEIETSVRLRLGQMRRFRDLLAGREHCLAEEQELYASFRHSAEADLEQQRNDLVDERTQWLAVREKEIDLQRQRAERVEQELRELSAHREQLAGISRELNSALDRVSSPDRSIRRPGASQSSNDSPGRISAREGQFADDEVSNVSTHLTQLLDLVGRQLNELDDGRRELTLRQQVRRSEDVEFSSWVEERERWIRQREAAFHQQLKTLSDREREWQVERQAWRDEQMQAERIIRDLVRQMEALLDPDLDASAAPGSVAA